MLEIVVGASICVVLALALGLFIIKRRSTVDKWANLPPSPPVFPLLGNLLYLKKDPHLAFIDLAKEYGDIFTFWFGRSKPVIILNDQKTARQAFINGAQALSGRPQRYTGSIYTKNFKGVVLKDDDKEWTFMRKLGHQALKTLGEEKFFTEQIIHDECNALVDRLSRRLSLNNVIHISKDMELSSLNVICALLFGSRYSEEDPEFHRISKANSWFIEGIKSGNMVDGFPILRYIPYRPLKLLKDFVKVRDEILERRLKEHEDTYNPGVIRDFTDALINSHIQQNSNKGEDYTREHSLALMADLFLTGTETTGTALKWAILYLSLWPDKQEKAHKSLECLQGELPKYSDRKILPYIEATMSEVLRMGSLAPLSVPHKATVDTELCGYHIPKGTILMMNAYSMHHDPAYWNEPDQFAPERFIHPDGHYFIPNSSYMPFSVGKRVCLGETLAKREMFLFLCYLLKHFRFEKVDNEEVYLDGKFGATLTPKPFRVKVLKRDCL
eukprot:Seg2011.4 transcript_id=Seg2011.4/GoldUCD/mRNA.D3Y31 product="Steroid 17-alpha-hydroxylase/17 20 lyase" protein_id=Seg2011.4/GoldUCD/D3Y31